MKIPKENYSKYPNAYMSTERTDFCLDLPQIEIIAVVIIVIFFLIALVCTLFFYLCYRFVVNSAHVSVHQFVRMSACMSVRMFARRLQTLSILDFVYFWTYASEEPDPDLRFLKIWIQI